MRIQIKKWGNSASVRIPASLMTSAALRFDQTVDISEQDGRIIIQAIASPSYDLDRMVDAMDPGTFHDDDAFAPPRGKEVW